MGLIPVSRTWLMTLPLREEATAPPSYLSQAGLSVTADKAGANASLSQHAVDITDRAAVQALPDAVIAAHGQVDGVINCAGIIQKFVPVMELEYADIERVINVNLWGTININKAFLPALTAPPLLRRR